VNHAQNWEERLQRAEYEAHLARRRYEAVDLDNRLVAAELERRWEEKLCQLYETQEARTHFLAAQDTSDGLSAEMREQFLHLSETLPSLWHGDRLTNAQKKELLRCLISHVIVKRGEPGRVALKIVWVSGHYSIREAWQPTRWLRDLPNYDELVERIEELWREGLTDTQIAAQLTGEGFRSAHSKMVTPATVGKLRLKYGWRCLPSRCCPDLEMEGYVTVAQLAARLGTYRQWIYKQIHSEWIDHGDVIRHPKYNAFLIRDDP